MFLDFFQIFGLILSIIGVGSIISNGEIQRITSLSFNKGDLWMLVCVFTWALYSTLLKKYKFKFSQFLCADGSMVLFIVIIFVDLN